MKKDELGRFRGVRIGYVCYLSLGMLWSLANIVSRVMGPCPGFGSWTDCQRSRVEELWLFPGSQIAFLLVAYLLWKVIKRIEA